MKLPVRWYKIFHDLSGNKTRTVLIVLSIAIGLCAIGIIANAQVVLSQEIARGYKAINPSSGTIRTLQAFDPTTLDQVRQIPGVADVDGRARFNARFKVEKDGAETNTGRWLDMEIYAVPDYDRMRVNKIHSSRGAWPPPAGEILIEQSAMGLVGAKVGDWLVIQTGAQEPVQLRIAGLAHDLCQVPAEFDNMPRGYIAYESLPQLGQPLGMNELHIVTNNSQDKAEISRVINRVKDQLEQAGFTIPLSMSADPGSVPLDSILQAVLAVLGVIGLLALFLSAFLIINTISALMAQQTRQIGIMKAIGARSGQITGMYLVMALIYGGIALLISLPISLVGGQVLSNFLAGLLNFDLNHFRIVPQAIALQVITGLLVPVLAAIGPLLAVQRVAASEAMNNYGISKDHYGQGRLDRMLNGLKPSRTARILSRPMVLSIRNTFRRKGRLALTLFTLSLGGAIFVGVFSMQASLDRTLKDSIQAYHSDVWVNFEQPMDAAAAEQLAMQIPDVIEAKRWGRTMARHVAADGSASDGFMAIGLPIENDLYRPTILEGRWLLPGDQRVVVMSSGAKTKASGVKVGGTVTLRIGGKDVEFKVVGISVSMGVVRSFYMSYADLAEITQAGETTYGIMAVTDHHGRAAQAQAATALEERFNQQGFPVNSVQLVSDETTGMEAGINIFIVMAIVMAVLLALVGGFGLMGTLGINVLERTREIGVMRAIGATDRSVGRIFIAEGVLIGLVSWFVGVLLAIPLGALLSSLVGQAILEAPLLYAFSLAGTAIWLVTVAVLSALASLLPSRSASRLTVREVLAYE